MATEGHVIAWNMSLKADTTALHVADCRVANEVFTLADERSTPEEEIQLDAIQRIPACAKKARSLVNEITEISTSLNNLFKNEREDSQERDEVLQFLNSFVGMQGHDCSKYDHVESSVANVLESTSAAADMLNKQCKILISSQRGTEEKIRKKTIDLERSSKHLESLKHTRPAYMDEYEQLEEDLKVEYEGYVVRLRNVDYLEEELSSFKQAAIERQERADRFVRRMRNKFREEELKILDRGSDLERAAHPVNPKQDCEHSERSGDSSTRSTHEEENNDTFSSGTSSVPSSEDGFSLDGSEITGLLESGSDSDYDF